MVLSEDLLPLLHLYTGIGLPVPRPVGAACLTVALQATVVTGDGGEAFSSEIPKTFRGTLPFSSEEGLTGHPIHGRDEKMKIVECARHVKKRKGQGSHPPIPRGKNIVCKKKD